MVDVTGVKIRPEQMFGESCADPIISVPSVPSEYQPLTRMRHLLDVMPVAVFMAIAVPDAVKVCGILVPWTEFLLESSVRS